MKIANNNINLQTEESRQRVKIAIKQRKSIVYQPVEPIRQLGFIHHTVDCIGCRACEIACKDKNGLPPGPRLRRVLYIEGGQYPDVFAYKINLSCNHCSQPACLPTCPTGAIWKRKDNGVVDIDSTLCIGCHRCEAACPYGAPQFDPNDGLVKKCNMCIDELEAGRKPYCVAACMMRVLDIGPIDQLLAGAYKTKAIGPNDKPVNKVKSFANPKLTKPSIAFIPHQKAKVEP